MFQDSIQQDVTASKSITTLLNTNYYNVINHNKPEKATFCRIFLYFGLTNSMKKCLQMLEPFPVQVGNCPS